MDKAFNLKPKANILGIAASSFCLVHCLATPFLFVTHAGHVHGHHSHPFWWGILDSLFIVISLFAVYWSAKNTSKNWMKYALWISWVLLSFVILNEKVGLIHLMEEAIYVPSLLLILLHLYNRKYCQCANDQCCTVP
ncbi:MerC domain-containing protein [uncultured Dokdonia sp.]|uniref:MerC domain-containing protein n=1 Tax=uncultured Dokdonia sp. TaxID=575653 RepID=UPI00263987A9|nr:MerC domain-containing protein [uncultured Dokdonia sp.]